MSDEKDKSVKLPQISEKYLKNQSIEQSFGESIDVLNAEARSRREYQIEQNQKESEDIDDDEDSDGNGSKSESPRSKDESFDEEKGNFTIFDHDGPQVDDYMGEPKSGSSSSSSAASVSDSSSEDDVAVMQVRDQPVVGAHLGDARSRRQRDIELEQKEIQEMNELAERHEALVAEDHALYKSQFGKQAIVRYFKFFISFVLFICFLNGIVFNIHNLGISKFESEYLGKQQRNEEQIKNFKHQLVDRIRGKKSRES